MPDGRIEPRQVEVLNQIGVWLKSTGDSIYGTRGGPFKPGDYGASTRKGRTIYLHVFTWPDGPLRLPRIPANIVSARVVKGGNAIVRPVENGVEITVPTADRDPNDTVVALKLDSNAMNIPAMDLPSRPNSSPH